MFYSPITLILGIVKDSKWRFQNSDYFNILDVIVTSVSLLMTTKHLLGTRILSDMWLLRLRGYTSNREEILIKYLFQPIKWDEWRLK